MKTETSVEKETRMWHLRFGHLNYQSLLKLSANDMVIGIPRLKISVIPQCESCIIAKSKRLPFPEFTLHRALRVGELIHVDLCGPLTDC